MLAQIRDETGAHIQVLSGRDEARLTFLAARRWFGWSSGKLLVVDIGGGSLEVAEGVDEEPDVAISLALGAGRLTRDWFTSDPPAPRKYASCAGTSGPRSARHAGQVMRDGQPDRAVATSKTFRQLARIAGAAPSSEGFYVRRRLSHADLTKLADRLVTMSLDERVQLAGVSRGRAPQLPAGRAGGRCGDGPVRDRRAVHLSVGAA